MRVIVAEDSALLREGLVKLLTEAGIEVVGETGDCEGLPQMVADRAPEVVMLDIRMPPSHTDEGIRAAAGLRERFPGVGVLLLSQYVETGGPLRALAASPRGFGYLLKERVADFGELHDALVRVAAGRVRHRLTGGRPAARPQTVRQRRRRAHRPRAGGARRHGRGPLQRGHHPVSGHQRQDAETHIRSIFTKFGLEPDTQYHRRVQAVITYLRV
ncbi:response regulator transcription factor [Streptomyces heliomycini]